MPIGIDKNKAFADILTKFNREFMRLRLYLMDVGCGVGPEQHGALDRYNGSSAGFGKNSHSP